LATQKYSGGGSFQPGPLIDLGVPEALAETVARAANFGIAASTFIGWLKAKRKVRSKTIKVYMAGIRMAHLCQGHNKVDLGGDLVSHILTGLRRMQWALGRKRLVWAMAALAFSGSFRVHELLSHTKTRYDPTSTLLCPILAMKKYLASLSFVASKGSPVFRTGQRQGYTGVAFNSDLHYVKTARVKRLKVVEEVARKVLGVKKRR